MYNIKLEYPLELGITSGYSGGYVSFTAQKASDIKKLMEELELSLCREWDRLFPKDYGQPWQDD